MYKISVISQPDEPFAPLLTEQDEIMISYSNTTNVPPDTSCILISQAFAGEKIKHLLQKIKYNGYTAVVMTYDQSDENQEYLIDQGAEHIILLPAKKSLLKKKIISIANQSAEESTVGFELFAQITDPSQQAGAFIVPERDFSTIYRFVQRLQDRMEKQAQLMVFHFHSRLNTPVEPGTLESTVPIVQKCLRRGDIVSINGQTITAILMGTDATGAQGAANRILATYEAYCCDSMFSLKYEISVIDANP